MLGIPLRNLTWWVYAPAALSPIHTISNSAL
jgi:hypothetical protein